MAGFLDDLVFKLLVEPGGGTWEWEKVMGVAGSREHTVPSDKQNREEHLGEISKNTGQKSGGNLFDNINHFFKSF